MTKPSEVPLVLIHGVGLDHTMWLPTTSALAHRRTVAYDVIGHGRARKPPGPYTLAMFVAQLSEIVNALGGDIDLVGFSMGALVAQGYALSAGRDRLRRMVLLNTVHDRSAEEREAILDRVAQARAGRFEASVEPALQRWFTPTFVAARPDAVAAVRGLLLDNDARSYADAYEVFATADAELARRTAEIITPTLVVTGGDDRRSTPAMTTSLATALPNASSVILPRLRHLTPIEAPDLVAKLIDEFTRP